MCSVWAKQVLLAPIFPFALFSPYSLYATTCPRTMWKDQLLYLQQSWERWSYQNCGTTHTYFPLSSIHTESWDSKTLDSTDISEIIKVSFLLGDEGAVSISEKFADVKWTTFTISLALPGQNPWETEHLCTIYPIVQVFDKNRQKDKNQKTNPKPTSYSETRFWRFWRNETTIWHSEMKPQHSDPPAVVLHFYTLLKTQFILQKLCVLMRGSHYAVPGSQCSLQG